MRQALKVGNAEIPGVPSIPWYDSSHGAYSTMGFFKSASGANNTVCSRGFGRGVLIGYFWLSKFPCQGTTTPRKLSILPGPGRLESRPCGDVMSAIGYSGKLEFDPSKPDGTPHMHDATRLNRLGWHPRVSLSADVEHTHGWFKKNMHARSYRVRTVNQSQRHAFIGEYVKLRLQCFILN
jgi:hypothetical protein